MEQNKDHSGEIPLCEQGNFYSLAKARGFTDFGMTISGKFYDEALQRFNEQYDASLAGEVDHSGAAVRGEAVASQYPVTLDDLCALLPGTYYMDDPDGGSVHVMEQLRRMSEDAAKWRARAADAPSEPSESQQKTIDCMDAWATSMQMPTYSELHALTEQYDALIRKICFQYAAGGYNSDGFMAPKSADLKLRWIIDEAYKAQSRAADALDSQPTDGGVRNG